MRVKTCSLYVFIFKELLITSNEKTAAISYSDPGASVQEEDLIKEELLEMIGFKQIFEVLLVQKLG